MCCGDCKSGVLDGLSVKCSTILKDAIIVGTDGKAMFDHEIAFVLVPLTFRCIDYEKDETREEVLLLS